MLVGSMEEPAKRGPHAQQIKIVAGSLEAEVLGDLRSVRMPARVML